IPRFFAFCLGHHTVLRRNYAGTNTVSVRTAKQKTKTAGEVGVFGENRTGCKTLIVVSNTILSCLLSRGRHKCPRWIIHRLANFIVLPPGLHSYQLPATSDRPKPPSPALRYTRGI